jgi:hypothetical protein
MEPVFMILAQSAATAAALALDAGVPLHQLDYARLRARLLADGQVLEWQAPRGAAAPAAKHPLLVRHPQALLSDDEAARHVGNWMPGSLVSTPNIGHGYVHDGAAADGQAALVFAQQLPAGSYDVFLLYPPHTNRATNAPVTLTAPGAAEKTIRINQRVADALGGASLGQVQLSQPGRVEVRLANREAGGHVVADAVAFVPRP